MKTEITALLGTEYPIIQGGMAWVAEHHLAAAVSEAGGLGIIGAANAPADWVREQIHKVRELTKKPFGVNVMLMSPYAEEFFKIQIQPFSCLVDHFSCRCKSFIEIFSHAGFLSALSRKKKCNLTHRSRFLSSMHRFLSPVYRSALYRKVLPSQDLQSDLPSYFRFWYRQ